MRVLLVTPPWFLFVGEWGGSSGLVKCLKFINFFKFNFDDRI